MNLVLSLSAIPQASCGTSNLRRPWWNEECRLARETQNKAWGVLCRYPTAQNLIAFKRAKAMGKRIRKEAKTNSWRSFKSSINSYTDTAEVWNRIRKLKGHKTNNLPLVTRLSTRQTHLQNTLNTYQVRHTTRAHLCSMKSPLNTNPYGAASHRRALTTPYPRSRSFMLPWPHVKIQHLAQTKSHTK